MAQDRRAVEAMASIKPVTESWVHFLAGKEDLIWINLEISAMEDEFFPLVSFAVETYGIRSTAHIFSLVLTMLHNIEVARRMRLQRFCESVGFQLGALWCEFGL